MWRCEVLLKSIELGTCQLNPLGVKGAPEFLSWKVSLTEDVVVLEELEDSDSVLGDHVLNLLHQ